MKSEYKTATGQDWKPGCQPPTQAPSGGNQAADASDLDNKIVAQGDKVRELKSKKAPKVGTIFLYLCSRKVREFIATSVLMSVCSPIPLLMCGGHFRNTIQATLPYL